MARHIAILLLVLSHLGIGAPAFTRFNPTCTLPTTQVNFVSSPDSRGTLNILWSCLFTIVACTWTIQHLNIPKQGDHGSKEQSRLHRMWYTVKQEAAESFWINLKWMLLTVVAPEFILGKAIGDFISAWRLKKEVDKMKEDGIVEACEEWELSHAFFSFMGGFRVLERDDFPKKETQRRESAPARMGQDNDHVSVKVLDGREAQDSRTKEHTNIQDHSTQTSLEWEVPGIRGSRIVPPNMLLSLREKGYISRLPNITIEEIHDKSKASFFIKAIAVIQVFWVSIQVIVRSVRGLAISQLELVVTAFSLCAIITYIFLLPKPQGAQVPMRPILIRRGDLGRLPNPDKWISLRALVIPGLYLWTDFLKDGVEVVPNDSAPGALKDLGTYALSISVGGMIFGSIHVAGWNLEFPTPTEQVVWRIASVVVTCLLPLALLPFILLTFVEWQMNRGQGISTRFPLRFGFEIAGFRGLTAVPRGGRPATGGRFVVENNRFRMEGGGTLIIRTAVHAQIWGLVFGVIYIIARLFLLVETFRTLAFLPPDTFIGTWVLNIPSIN